VEKINNFSYNYEKEYRGEMIMVTVITTVINLVALGISTAAIILVIKNGRQKTS